MSDLLLPSDKNRMPIPVLAIGLAQEKFMLMSVDENGDKFWRLNFNVQQKTSDEGQFFECDFVPKDGGMLAETPTVDLFHDELIKFGLTEEEISKI